MSKDQKKYAFFKEVNRLRRDPKEYASELQKIIPRFINQTEIILDNTKIKTLQGKKLWYQSIEFLKKQESVDELQWSDGLYLAAKHTSKYIAQNLDCNPLSFIEKYVDYRGEMKVWTTYNAQTVRQFLRNSIVCDGDKTRDKRTGLLSKKMKYFGSYANKQIEYGNFMTFFMAEEIILKRKQKLTASKLIREINKLRVDPKSFLPDIKSQVLMFKNKYIRFNQQCILKTNEGKKAWLEAIQYLKNKNPSMELEYQKDLNKIALKKAKNSNLEFSKFIAKYSNIKGKAKYIENFGCSKPRDIVVSLLVSDGDITRSSRNIILSQQYSSAGGFIDVSVGNQGCGLLLIQKQKQCVLNPVQRIQRSLSLKSVQSIKDLKEYVMKKQQLKKNLNRYQRSTSNQLLPQLNNLEIETKDNQQYDIPEVQNLKTPPPKRLLRRNTQNDKANTEQPKDKQFILKKRKKSSQISHSQTRLLVT